MNHIPWHGRLRPPSVPRLVRRRVPRSQGQAIVELALILPVLLVLLASALDLGRLFYSRITVNDAAREAVLEASKNPTSYIANTTCTSVNAESNRVMCRALNEARGGFVTVAPTDVTMTCSTVVCPPATAVLGDTVSISVDGRFTLVTPLLAVFFGGQSITFSSTASAQLLTVPITPVVAGPVAAFSVTPTSGTAPLAVTVTDASTSGPTTWAWGFGDGATYNGQTPPAHSYTAAGTYTITLTVSNSGGQNTTTNSVTVTVAVPIPTAPVAAFTLSPSSGAVPLAVTVSDTSTGTPTTWAWTFGDGATASVQSPPAHTYVSAGVYNVTLTVMNDLGSSSVSHPVNSAVACPTPVASFTVNPTTGKKRQANFVVTDSSTNMTTAGCANTWSWNFGDGSGNSSLQAPPPHVYNSAGTYTIQLTVSNTGHTSTAPRTVTVTP